MKVEMTLKLGAIAWITKEMIYQEEGFRQWSPRRGVQIFTEQMDKVLKVHQRRHMTTKCTRIYCT